MTLEELTGQEAIIYKILVNLEKGKIISADIKGVSGSGKSWLLQKLANSITDKGGCVIKLQGDPERIKEVYYPLNVFIEQKNKTGNKSIKAAKKLVGEIPFVGASAESFLEDIDLQSFSKTNSDFEAFGLNKQKQFATHATSLLNKHSTLAIICDDIQDFDQPTIDYLDCLIKFLNAQTFETRVAFIFGFNVERENTTNYPSWLSSVHFEYNLKRIDRSQLVSALLLFGLKHTLREPELDLIYTSTGGHLHVLRTIVAYLNRNQEKNLLQEQGNTLMHNLLENRLQQIQQYYKLIKELLLALGGVGKSGSKAELLCLLEKNDDLADAMKHAEDLEFITIKDGYLHFTHEIVKDYISAQENKRKPSFYRKYSDCLRALNPSNYLRRAWAEGMAGNKEKADAFRALFIIQRIRLGLYEEVNELINLFNSEDAERMTSAVKIFKASYQQNSDSSLNEGLLSLSLLPYDLPQELLAEKIYLECEILLKHTDYPSRQEALQKLESWDILKEEEPEQWYRFSHLKLLANSELGNFEMATKIEQEIAIFFTKRANFDVSAKDILNRLNLFSEIVYSPDIAHIKLSQTYHSLKREIENENFDKLLDYYISLCNLSGNCISTNRLPLSLEYGKEAIGLIKGFPHIYFPHKEVALNNLLLASYFLKVESPEKVLSTFRQLANEMMEEDGILINSNIAGILIQQNRIDEAQVLLQEKNSLIAENHTDPFYFYHHRFNYGLTLYLAGQKDQAISVLEPLTKLEGQINNKLTTFYKRHFELTLELINQNDKLSYSEMCEQFQKKQPRYLSIVWDKFKPVYLFTDLQIWTNN